MINKKTISIYEGRLEEIDKQIKVAACRRNKLSLYHLGIEKKSITCILAAEAMKK